jgi:hypothetical protein
VIDIKLSATKKASATEAEGGAKDPTASSSCAC